MAPKNHGTGDGIVARVIRQFEAGLLEISIESALNKVGRCRKFGGKGKGVCGAKCKKIHLTNEGEIRPSVGLYIACELERDPSSHPGVHVDPLLALQGFLLDNKSSLIIDHWFKRDNAYVFRFAEQHVSSVVKMIARQKFVNINVDGVDKTLHWSDDVETPSLVLHAVSQNSMQNALSILVNGFCYGPKSKPFGIYSVDATNESQSGKIRFYDGGVSIVLKPTGFIANISEKSANGKPRDNTNKWLTGAPPGVVLFRRMNDGLREFIMHKDTVTFAYISMEEEIFKAWALEFGVANPDAIRKAHKTRREWKERAGVVIPSGPEISNAEYETAQTMAAPEPWPDHYSVLTVAQPPFGRSRSRSRSPSVPRPDTMSGVEIAAPREPDVLLEQLNVYCSRTIGVATEVDAALSERLEQKDDMKGFAQPDRPRDPARWTIPSEKDRRIIFVPPGFRYVEMDPLELKEEGLQKEAAASSGGPSSGTSLEAARSVLREDCPKSIAGNPAAWKPLGKVCAGANCNKTMMDKAEWNRDHGRFYCHTCYDNLWNPKKPCEGCNKTMVDKTEWNKYDGRFYCHTCYDNLWNSKKQPCEGRNCNKTMDKTEWKKDHGRYYCHTCYDSLDWKNPKKRKLSDSAAAASSGAQGALRLRPVPRKDL